MTTGDVAYVYNNNLQMYANILPPIRMRSSMIHDLISSYGLLEHPNVKLVDPPIATFEDLVQFHSHSYVDFIKTNKAIHPGNEKQAEAFGLLYDCPLLPDTYNYMTAIAGASLEAATLLNTKQYKYVINWYGGWHHAQRDKSGGFCYVNDIVLAIQTLQKIYPKVLYLDLDVHHGDGVEEAFKQDKNTLTMSIHNGSRGFYPGTGILEDSTGEKAIVNVPLLDGISDGTYSYVFQNIFNNVYNAFEPDAIVLQCGGDILAGDPLGQCNVTIKTMENCIKKVINCDKPTMFLGGGGYHPANVARYWCSLTSLILGVELDSDIPDTCEHFQEYIPTFELDIDPILGRKDYNTREYVNSIIDYIKQLSFR